MSDDFCERFPDVMVSSVLDAIPHAIAVVDRDLRVVAINEFLEALTGLSLSDVRGVYIDFVLRSNIAQRGRTFREVLGAGEPLVIEGNIISRDRRKLSMQFTISPLRNREEETVGLVIALDNLSTVVAASGMGPDQDLSESIIGQSPKMREVFDLIPLMAHTEASVLITGETGTGKDKIAEAIHKRSNRTAKPFIKINCGALPESLLESELFGYVKGAFTGAVKDKPGMFRLAQGGTLFLTEIGDMPLPLQVKLLSVLDDREFFPLGGEKKIKVDVRIIAATHRPLKERVAAGEFREDLYYRLNVLHLHLPPLRERETDTRFLLNHFLRLFAERTGSTLKNFSDDALKLLMDYSYPGNIRELRNIVEYCVNICQNRRIEVEHLPKYLFARTPPPPPPPAAPQPVPPVETPAPVSSNAGKDWQAIEKDLIIEALTQTRGNRSKAAEILGWGRTTLWRKLKIHGLVGSAEQGNIKDAS
ncbi:MAG: sigma-54 interaction domain-containing protein [Desulfobulbus sp.]